MLHDLVIADNLESELLNCAFDGNYESGAFLLFAVSHIERDPWLGTSRKRYLLRNILPLDADSIDEATPTRLRFGTEQFVRLLKKAREEDLVIGFVHGHPSGHDGFSSLDNQNERELARVARNRNGKDAELISVLALPDGSLRARVWVSDQTDSFAAAILVTGRKLIIHKRDCEKTNKKTLARQALAFGDKFNRSLGDLRVVVVGAGGTGSPLALMLARAGVGKIAVIDPDVVEETNLHRLHGIGNRDIGKAKAAALEEHINELGLNTHFLGLRANCMDPEVQDMLKAADVVFGATDDHAGRMLLNRFSYFYCIPLIDCGLAITPFDASRPIQHMTGRVTVVCQNAPCLLCRRIIDPIRARDQELQRRDPDAFEGQVKEGYVLGGGDPEPAFIAMTTAVACMALEEFTQLLSQFRGDRTVLQRLRRFQIPEDRLTAGESHPECPICRDQEYWNLGDVQPFLDRVS